MHKSFDYCHYYYCVIVPTTTDAHRGDSNLHEHIDIRPWTIVRHAIIVGS